MPRGINISGLREFQNKLANLPTVVLKEVGFEVFDAAQLWEERSKLAAPVDQGRLRSEIRALRKDELTAEVVCNVDYAAYLEWGTKTKVSVPADIADYAAQFRGNKGAGNAKEMIYAWMNRVGIPVESQWFIFISIIVKGITPHPFFFIQAPVVEKQLVENINKILNTSR